MSFLKELSYFVLEVLMLIMKILFGAVAFLFVGIGMFIVYIKNRAEARRNHNHWRIK